MRRKDREIINKNELIEILDNADVCRIAMNDNEFPYIVPLNYGYNWNDKLEIFFHCAKEGHKINLLSKNNKVSFEIDCGHELVKNEIPCNWGMKYRSIIGKGIINEVNNDNEKIISLNYIMKHYGFSDNLINYKKTTLDKVKVLKLEVLEMTGKQKK